MPLLKIIKPGLHTTIQDRGRPGYQKWGVPAAGAMDEYALRVANILAGNHEDEGCLELTLAGPEIEFAEPGLVALAGADLGARLNGCSIEPWQSFRVGPGDVLQFAGARSGCRCYLAVAGGLNIPRVMGSKSTYLRASIGGLEGRALREGDELETEVRVSRQSLTPRKVPPEYIARPENPQVVRVVLGPQDDAFTREGINTFLQSDYEVKPESDRMGCRLQGPVIGHKDGPDIVSDGIIKGSVQVPGDGNPIVMMADRQTAGGYAKIATVITPDLWKLAQARPGERICFRRVTLEQAHEAYRHYENMLKKLPENLTLVNRGVWLVKVNGRAYRVEIEEK